MPISAVIMLIIGCLVLYGGLAYCIFKTFKRKNI
jgi:hypothetical protein